MSSQLYNLKWKQTLNDLMININLENEPLEENEAEKGIKYKRSDEEWFYYNGHLYIRYI